MTQEPTRNPAIVRALLQAYLSTTPVREAMMDLQKRMHGLPYPEISSARIAAKSVMTFRLRRSLTFFAKPFSALF